jgi:hypothetical protein
MTRAELIAEVRYVIDDSVGPNYAWSDNRIVAWLSEGQDKFCEKTGFWSDKSSYSITTVLGQQDYPVDSRIISVRSIWDGSRQLLDATDSTISSADFSDTPAQAPNYYVMDLATGYVTFPEPVVAGIVLTLRTHRRSLVPFSRSGAAMELPDGFHLAPVEYAAHKAFGDHDRELQDPVKATDHLANFKRYVAEGKLAYRRITGEYSDVVAPPYYVV